MSTVAEDNRSVASAFGRLARRPEAGSFLGMIIVFAFFAVLGGKVFVGAPGFSSWLNTAAEVGIIALPVGLLMIAGELDLSVGSVIPASSLTVAIISGHYDAPEAIGILAGARGRPAGRFRERLSRHAHQHSVDHRYHRHDVRSHGAYACFTVMIAGSTGVFIVPDPVTKAVLGQFVGGMFQVTMFWWAGFIVVIYYLLHISHYGNWIYAIGGDRESARNAGIRPAS